MIRKKKIRELKSLKEIPEFSNYEEEAKFWDTHSVSQIWEQLEPVELEIDAALIEKRLNRQLFKLEPSQVRAALNIAQRKKVDFLSLIKQWIDEGINRESETDVSR